MISVGKTLVIKPFDKINDDFLTFVQYDFKYLDAGGANRPPPFYNIKIPQGIKGGNTLRLKELGKLSPTGTKGDLMLKVTVQS